MYEGRASRGLQVQYLCHDDFPNGETKGQREKAFKVENLGLMMFNPLHTCFLLLCLMRSTVSQT
jgi:hypothetical protein